MLVSRALPPSLSYLVSFSIFSEHTCHLHRGLVGCIFSSGMELLRDVEPALEGTAALFEEAGLGSSAAALRSSIPLATLESAFAICLVLEEAQAHEKVSDLAFWVQGAVLAGADGDIDLFGDCLRMARRVMLEVWADFAVH